MDGAAPITWVIGKINELVATGAAAGATALATTITPLASICFGIYIMLIALNALRGAESDPVGDLFVRLLGFCVIIGLGLNADTYVNTVIPIVTGLGDDLASGMLGGDPGTGVLDKLVKHYVDILNQTWEALTGLNPTVYLMWLYKALLVIVGLTPFILSAAAFIVIADVGSVMVAMLGPMYFAFLIFPATRQYFSAWLNTAFSYALIPVLLAVVANLSIGISQSLFTIEDGVVKDFDLFQVYVASVCNLLLVLLLRQISSMASSLSAGGINAAMPSGMASAMTGKLAAKAAAPHVAAGKLAGKGAVHVGKAAWNRIRQGSIRKAG